MIGPTSHYLLFLPFFVRAEHRPVSGGRNGDRGGQLAVSHEESFVSSRIWRHFLSWHHHPAKGEKKEGEKIKPPSRPTRGAVGPRVTTTTTKQGECWLAKKKNGKGPTRHPRNSHPFSGAPWNLSPPSRHTQDVSDEARKGTRRFHAVPFEGGGQTIRMAGMAGPGKVAADWFEYTISRLQNRGGRTEMYWKEGISWEISGSTKWAGKR